MFVFKKFGIFEEKRKIPFFSFLNLLYRIGNAAQRSELIISVWEHDLRQPENQLESKTLRYFFNMDKRVPNCARHRTTS